MTTKRSHSHIEIRTHIDPTSAKVGDISHIDFYSKEALTNLMVALNQRQLKLISAGSLLVVEELCV
jgi:hypothetical protein